jgi:hypothetical protein
LLHVAMTRAKDELDLIVPQRLFMYQQNGHDSGHVYASISRFIPKSIIMHLKRSIGVNGQASRSPADRGRFLEESMLPAAWSECGGSRTIWTQAKRSRSMTSWPILPCSDAASSPH